MKSLQNLKLLVWGKLNFTDLYDNNSAKHTSTFSIPKMDCSAEEQMVRMAFHRYAVKALSLIFQKKVTSFHTMN
jgi:hypothetical protein